MMAHQEEFLTSKKLVELVMLAHDICIGCDAPLRLGNFVNFHDLLS